MYTSKGLFERGREEVATARSDFIALPFHINVF